MLDIAPLDLHSRLEDSSKRLLYPNCPLEGTYRGEQTEFIRYFIKDMNNHYYNKNLKTKARQLRKEGVSIAERTLWSRLLRKKQTGFKFLRQRAIGNYIVDFFCPDLKLIIEVDGNSHNTKGASDALRQRYLEDRGFTVIRFAEDEVLNHLENVKLRLSHSIFCLQKKN